MGMKKIPPFLRKTLFTILVIVIYSLAVVIYEWVKYERDAHTYLQNCKDVPVGISIQEAKEIMGDRIYYKRQNRSEIWLSNPYKKRDNPKYYLIYPTGFGASQSIRIYFDPTSQLVTKVVCATDEV